MFRIVFFSDDYNNWRKSTKKSRYFAQNQGFKHKISKKNHFFHIFVCFSEMNVLYLSANCEIFIF